MSRLLRVGVLLVWNLMVWNCEKVDAIDTTQVSRVTSALKDAQRDNVDRNDDGGCFVSSLRRELNGRDCTVALADGDHRDRGCRVALALMNCELRAAEMEPVTCNEYDSCGACAVRAGQRRNKSWGAARLLRRLLLNLSDGDGNKDDGGDDSLALFAIYQSWRQSAFAACQLITEHDSKRTLIRERNDATIFAAEMRDVIASGGEHVKAMVDDIRDAVSDIAHKLEHINVKHEARLDTHLEKLNQAEASAERAASATNRIHDLVEPTARKLEAAGAAAANIYAHTADMIRSIEAHRGSRTAFATMGFFAVSCIAASFVASALRHFAHAINSMLAQPIPHAFSVTFDCISRMGLLALLASEALIVAIRAAVDASTVSLLGIDALPSKCRRLFIIAFFAVFLIHTAFIFSCAIAVSARRCIDMLFPPPTRLQSTVQEKCRHARRAHLGVERYSHIDHSGRVVPDPEPDVVASLLRKQLDRKLDAMVEDRQQALLTQQMMMMHNPTRSP